MGCELIELQEDTFAAAFNEWDKRYRANPEEFWSTVTHLLGNTPETYGEAAAAYFMLLLSERAERLMESK